MKKTKAELSRIAKRAVKTRQENIRRVKSQQAGKRAYRETIRPSEHEYIDELAKKQGVKRDHIFHHEGLPDLMVITSEGKMRFYEIKPKKGSLERKMLNQKQTETIKELLKHDYVQEVNLVRYAKQGKRIVYDPPIKLTKSNISRYGRAR